MVDETIDHEQRRNLKSPYFTLNRTTPLSILHQKKTVTTVSI